MAETYVFNGVKVIVHGFEKLTPERLADAFTPVLKASAEA